MRELKRSIAKANMKDFGIPHINRKRTVTIKGALVRTSYFAQNWKKWVSGNPLKKGKRKNG